VSPLDSSHGVFNDNAPLGRNADSGSGYQVHLWIGFALVHVFTAYDALKHVVR
jgi:hypothetical protein